MRSSIQIHNEIKALKGKMVAVPDNARDRNEQLYRLEGQITALEDELTRTLAAEDQARLSMGGTAVGGSADARSSITAQAFGPRESFAGVTAGYRAAITIPSNPGVTDPNMPGFADTPRGFADTLIQAPTTGSVTFLQRGARTNGAAQWKDADGEKAESSYVWTEENAPLTWIAHHTPIAKTEASDWGQLDAIVRNEMLVGLSQAKSVAALTGSNAAGITGVINTTGIQTYDPAVDGEATDTVYDSIRRMSTKVLLTSGFRPTHVAMSPQVREELDLLKSSVDEHYLAVSVGGQVWDLQIVEDTGLTITDGEGATHYGCIVYANVGATWYTKEIDNVEVGLVDSQFIENAYTLLAEGRNALAVKYPDAFCYCEDAIDELAAVS